MWKYVMYLGLTYHLRSEIKVTNILTQQKFRGVPTQDALPFHRGLTTWGEALIPCFCCIDEGVKNQA
jgi:hypothetical protein